MKVIIMAGGQGTRFWPWSVKNKPKQFLPLISEETMLEQTYHRFRKWLPSEKIYVVTTEEYSSLVKKLLPSLKGSQIIIEPMKRDTAPCMALTASKFLKKGDDEPFIVVPADHYIPDDSAFPDIFQLAEKIIEFELSIVTLGIKPTRPETGFGYIKSVICKEGNDQYYKVEKFIEKPNQEKAEELISSENVYWNSGIFICKPSTIAYYMEKFQPDMWRGLKNAEYVSKSLYSQFAKISVDYAILEKAETIYTIPVSFLWDDIGSWSAWERFNKKETENNVLQGDIHNFSANNCVIKSSDKKTIVIGVEDLIIASTEEGLLVCHKSQEPKIKEVLKDVLNENE